jgi:UDP-glucose 6-dehydrogenase
MDIRMAEVTKYAAKAILATQICLLNELANLAEKLLANIE